MHRMAFALERRGDSQARMFVSVKHLFEIETSGESTPMRPDSVTSQGLQGNPVCTQYQTRDARLLVNLSVGIVKNSSIQGGA
jgi:hypothetical protein